MSAQSATTRITMSRWLAQYRWVPWAFVACFVLIFAVNGGLVYYALESWPGLTTDHAYDEGLAYNRVIDETAKEAKLGWKFSIDFARADKGSLSGRLVIDAKDGAGAALEGLAIRADLVRPVGDMPEMRFPVSGDGNGHYEAKLTLPRPGQWQVYIVAREGGTVFHTGARILVQ